MRTTQRQSVVITGASCGIGAACALHLDELGFEVFAGVRDRADGESLRSRAGGRLRPIVLDVTDEASVGEACQEVSAHAAGSSVLGLVNNAGIALAGPLELLALEDVRYQLEVNTIGPLAVIQRFLPLLRNGPGRIINISSIAGRAVTPFLGAYGASKFALEAMSDALRLELLPWGITVSLVEPGAVSTEIWSRSKRSAEERLGQVAPARLALYAAAMERLRHVTRKAEARAIPAAEVARVVGRALTAKRPKSRYLVGADAHLRAGLRSWLPDRAQDAVIRWFMGLPARPPQFPSQKDSSANPRHHSSEP